MAWVFAIFAIFLLIKFPKQMGVILGVIALVIGGFIYNVFSKEWDREKQEKAIKIFVAYDTSNCGNDYPLAITIKNESNRTLTKIEWSFVARKKGFSNNLADWLETRKSDKILKKGEEYRFCSTLPSLDTKEHPKNLIWSADSRWIYFE